MRQTVGGAHNVVTLLAAIVSSRRAGVEAALVGDEHRGADIPRREEAAPGVFRPARRRHVQVDVAGQQPQPVHRRQMPDRIGPVRVQHQLRLRRRAGGEIQQQRIVRIRLAIRAKVGRGGQQVVVAGPAGTGSPMAMRVSCGRAPSNSGLRAGGHDMPRPAAIETIGQVVEASNVVAGITTAPSFIDASMTSHSGTMLPSISRMRSPRLTPAAQAVGHAVGAFREFGESQPGRAVADNDKGRLVRGGAARQFAIEPVERPVELATSGQRKSR